MLVEVLAFDSGLHPTAHVRRPNVAELLHGGLCSEMTLVIVVVVLK